MSERDDRLAREVRRVLDEDVAHLDEATRARLREGRRMALDAAADRRGLRRGWWLPAGAVAISAVLAVVLWAERHVPAAPVLAPVDLELLTARDSLDLYRDLDFYQWLAQERKHAS